MTLVIAEFHKSSLSVTADTRIVDSNDESLTEHAPKILRVPVISRSGFDEQERTAATTYGFAFSGSLLAALSVHGTASGCAASLWATELQPVPSVEGVAQLFCHVASFVVKEPRFGFQAFIMGFCKREARPRAFLLNCRGLEQPSLAELDAEPETYHPIGSGAQFVPEYLEEARRRNPGSGIAEVFRIAIHHAKKPDVGGYTQYGTCSEKHAFRVYPIVRKRLGGKFHFYHEFNGVPIDGLKIEGLKVGGTSGGADWNPIGERPAPRRGKVLGQ